MEDGFQPGNLWQPEATTVIALHPNHSALALVGCWSELLLNMECSPRARAVRMRGALNEEVARNSTRTCFDDVGPHVLYGLFF